LHLVGILFPHINDDARSKSHQKKQLLLQITYKFTKKTYSQYQPVSSVQTAQTSTAPFM